MTALWTVKSETARPSLEEMQAFVGGRIELVYLSNGDHLVINEEGLLDNLPINTKASRIWWDDLGIDRRDVPVMFYDSTLPPPLVGNVILVEGGLD